jgi:hypothetical protein
MLKSASPSNQVGGGQQRQAPEPQADEQGADHVALA